MGLFGSPLSLIMGDRINSRIDVNRFASKVDGGKTSRSLLTSASLWD